MTLPTPDPIFTLSDTALACLGAAVNANPNPPAHIAFRVGTEIPHDVDNFRDLCCEGLAYVSLGETAPSKNGFPDPDVTHANMICNPPAWAQQLRMGIVRCVPVMGEQGEMPTDAEWNAAHTQNIYDSISLRRAVCCLRTFVNADNGWLLGMSTLIETQQQVNPQGGCIERFVTFWVQIPNCDCQDA